MDAYRTSPRLANPRAWGCFIRLLIPAAIALISVIGYYSMRSPNPVTGETQHISLSVDQEIALGLQAAPAMAAQYGGLHGDQEARLRIEEIGQRIVQRSDASKGPYQFAFHVLADDRTINAFALPGGQIFITAGLLNRLQTDGQIAGVLGHEIGHVVGRHSAEHIAKAQLVQGLTAAAVLAAYDPYDPSTYNTPQFAALIGQLVNLKFGRDDELESDRLGVKYMAQSGYDPRAMVAVMEVLRTASEGGPPPEFFSTHPNPDRRIDRIGEAIAAEFPDGLPQGLEQ